MFSEVAFKVTVLIWRFYQECMDIGEQSNAHNVSLFFRIR